MTVGRWRIGLAATLALVGVGLLFAEPTLLGAAVVPLAYVCYGVVSGLSTAPRLRATRSFDPEEPGPGEQVTVRLHLENAGDSVVPDLRIVDGVPESLAVTDGSPRRGVRLREGESVTFSYTVQARQGTHEFGPTQVVARTFSNSTEQELAVGQETTVTAVPPLRPVQESVPLRRQPTQYAGRAPTDSGGEGIEFHTVREYKPGDSMARIDWNRRARTGELTTLEFRRERATRVVLLVDARPGSHVGHDPLAMDAVERSLGATQRVFPALLSEGHQVGIAAFGPAECFLAPDTGTSHRQRGRDLLATASAFHSQTGPDEQRRFWVAQLRKQLPDNTQLLLFSPMLDDRTVRVVREFEAYGYPTVAASDAHTLPYVGRAYTEITIPEVDREAVTREDVLTAIRNGSTAVQGRRAPVPMAAKHYAIGAARKSGYYAKAGTLQTASYARFGTLKSGSLLKTGVERGLAGLGKLAAVLR